MEEEARTRYSPPCPHLGHHHQSLDWGTLYSVDQWSVTTPVWIQDISRYLLFWHEYLTRVHIIADTRRKLPGIIECMHFDFYTWCVVWTLLTSPALHVTLPIYPTGMFKNENISGPLSDKMGRCLCKPRQTGSSESNLLSCTLISFGS